MSKIVQLHYKNLITVLYNRYKGISEHLTVSDFLRLLKIKKLVPEIISVADLTSIINKVQTPFLDLPDFEKILNEVSQIGFANSNPNERLSLLLQKLTHKTRTLSGSEFDVKTAFGLAKKLELSANFVNNSISQRNITKKAMARSKISETILTSVGKKKLNGTSIENALKPMKSDERKLNLSNALTGKHTRTSSLDAKADGITEKAIIVLTNTQSKLSKAKMIITKLKSRNFQATKPKKNLRFSYRSIAYLQRARKSNFSSDFFLRIILRSWFLYVKSKKNGQRPPIKLKF